MRIETQPEDYATVVGDPDYVPDPTMSVEQERGASVLIWLVMILLFTLFLYVMARRRR